MFVEGNLADMLSAAIARACASFREDYEEKDPPLEKGNQQPRGRAPRYIEPITMWL